MGDRRELLLFGVLLLLAGALAGFDLTDRYVSRRVPSPRRLDVADLDPVARVQLDVAKPLDEIQRELSIFSPPRELTSLDPLLINEILLSISTFDYGFEDQYINDWLDNPTDRLHNVIYALIVYGVDTHDWEELASEVRWANDRTSFAALKQ